MRLLRKKRGSIEKIENIFSQFFLSFSKSFNNLVLRRILRKKLNIFYLKTINIHLYFGLIFFNCALLSHNFGENLFNFFSEFFHKIFGFELSVHLIIEFFLLSPSFFLRASLFPDTIPLIFLVQ